MHERTLSHWSRNWDAQSQAERAIKKFIESGQAAIPSRDAPSYSDAANVSGDRVQPVNDRPAQPRQTRRVRRRGVEKMALDALNLLCITATGSLFLFLVMLGIDVIMAW